MQLEWLSKVERVDCCEQGDTLCRPWSFARYIKMKPDIILYMMNCNKEIHDEIKAMDYITCPFCDKKIQERIVKHETCCENVRLKRDGMIVCVSCGCVDSYEIADEYIYFYDNKHRLVKRSVYHREYHIQNTIKDICSKNDVQIKTHEDKLKIMKIFNEIEIILPQIYSNRKRMISTYLIIRRVFELMKHPYENIQITKSEKTGFLLSILVRHYEFDRWKDSNDYQQVNFSSYFIRNLSTIGLLSDTVVYIVPTHIQNRWLKIIRSHHVFNSIQ